METVTFLLKKKHESARERTYPSSTKVQDVLQAEKTSHQKIFFDGGSSITRIGYEDPINHYFGGQVDDIYRIEDTTSLRYRIVYNLTDKNTARDVKKTVAPLTPEEMFIRAKKTLKELYNDRKYAIDIMNEEDLLIEGYHANKKGLYTILIELEFMKKNIGHLFKSDKMTTLLACIQRHFPTLHAFDVDRIDQSCVEYSKYANIIIIYDNPGKGNLAVKMKHHHSFLQFMAIQQIQFNISHHVLQPKMTLLDPCTDREEILELYMLMGEELCPEKTLSDYAMTPETKLIII